MRNKSKSKFNGDCFKLKINSIFGKTLENIDKRLNIRLVTQWEKNINKDGASNLI